MSWRQITVVHVELSGAPIIINYYNFLLRRRRRRSSRSSRRRRRRRRRFNKVDHGWWSCASLIWWLLLVSEAFQLSSVRARKPLADHVMTDQILTITASNSHAKLIASLNNEITDFYVLFYWFIFFFAFLLAPISSKQRKRVVHGT